MVEAEPTNLADLGEELFFDKQLSYYGDISCANCHLPELAYTDGYRKSFNGFADKVATNSTSLLNLTTKKFYHSSDPSINAMLKAVERPFYAEHPLEMGWQIGEDKVLNTINLAYAQKYNRKIDKNTVVQAIISFLDTQVSQNSIYDQYLNTSDTSLFTQSQWNGMKLFFSETVGCSNCHGGTHFNEPKVGEVFANNQFFRSEFEGVGLSEFSGDLKDRGKYRIPTLRNIAITFPYYYDGTGNSLEEVVEHYIQGSRHNLESRDSTLHDERLKRVALTADDKRDLIDFLYTLTDTTYMDHLKFYR